jgi:hypothetical protein
MLIIQFIQQILYLQVPYQDYNIGFQLTIPLFPRKRLNRFLNVRNKLPLAVKIT